MVNPNVFTVPVDLQQALSKYKVLTAEYVYRPLSEAEAQDWSNAMCLDKASKISWHLLQRNLLGAAVADYSLTACRCGSWTGGSRQLWGPWSGCAMSAA